MMLKMITKSVLHALIFGTRLAMVTLGDLSLCSYSKNSTGHLQVIRTWFQHDLFMRTISNIRILHYSIIYL